jgi:hypothetical protein
VGVGKIKPLLHIECVVSPLHRSIELFQYPPKQTNKNQKKIKQIKIKIKTHKKIIE